MTLFKKNLVCKNLVACAIGFAISISPLYAAEEKVASLVDALKQGKTQLQFRLRYEDVDQDGAEPAAATTLKTRLSYSSAKFNGFGLTVEMDDTTALFDDDYSDGVINNGTAVIADPEVTEINQAYISYTSGPTTAIWGRQRILLDNQRFVGGVGWRQDEQTYTGFTVTSTPVEDLSLFYGYITEVNRIFAEAQDHNHDTHLLNLKYKTPFGSLVGYGYAIDNQSVLGLSSKTFGARWEGKAGDFFSYNLEYATQKENADNPKEYSADYLLAEAIGSIPVGKSKINLKAGYEVLGSDEGTQGFTTSLATLHAFQGWADKFLGTPTNGIVDTYLSIGSKISSVEFGLIYHTLSSDFGDLDYGNEIDFVASTKVGPIGLVLKYADYSADELYTDTSKIWLMASASF